MGDVFCPVCATLLAPSCPLCGAPAMLDQEVCALCDVELGIAVIARDSGLLESIVAEVESQFSDEPLVTGSAGAPAATQPIASPPVLPHPPATQSAPEAAPVRLGRFCTNCGTESEPQAAFCVRCGTSLR